MKNKNLLQQVYYRTLKDGKPGISVVMLYPSGNIVCRILATGIDWPGYSASNLCSIASAIIFIRSGVKTLAGVRTGVVGVTTGGLPNAGTVLDEAGMVLGV